MSNVEHPEHYNAGAVECIDGVGSIKAALKIWKRQNGTSINL